MHKRGVELRGKKWDRPTEVLVACYCLLSGNGGYLVHMQPICWQSTRRTSKSFELSIPDRQDFYQQRETGQILEENFLERLDTNQLQRSRKHSLAQNTRPPSVNMRRISSHHQLPPTPGGGLSPGEPRSRRTSLQVSDFPLFVKSLT